MVEKLINTFYETFGDGGDIRTYFAPGRVNLTRIITEAMYFHARLPLGLTES